MQRYTLDSTLAGLLGFAKRARQLSTGSEAVNRDLRQKKLAIVLVDHSLSVNSLQRLQKRSEAVGVPLIVLLEGDVEGSLPRLIGNKIIGVVKGSMAQGIVQKLNQESS